VTGKNRGMSGLMMRTLPAGRGVALALALARAAPARGAPLPGPGAAAPLLGLGARARGFAATGGRAPHPAAALLVGRAPRAVSPLRAVATGALLPRRVLSSGGAGDAASAAAAAAAAAAAGSIQPWPLPTAVNMQIAPGDAYFESSTSVAALDALLNMTAEGLATTLHSGQMVPKAGATRVYVLRRVAGMRPTPMEERNAVELPLKVTLRAFLSDPSNGITPNSYGDVFLLVGPPEVHGRASWLSILHMPIPTSSLTLTCRARGRVAHGSAKTTRADASRTVGHRAGTVGGDAPHRRGHVSR
jgi:hypothetical protein